MSQRVVILSQSAWDWRFIKHRFWSPGGYQRRGLNCTSASKKMLVARLSEDEDHYSHGQDRAWCCKSSSGRGLGLKDIGLSTGSVLWLNPLLQPPLLRTITQVTGFALVGMRGDIHIWPRVPPFLSISLLKTLENSVQQWSCLFPCVSPEPCRLLTQHTDPLPHLAASPSHLSHPYLFKEHINQCSSEEQNQ